MKGMNQSDKLIENYRSTEICICRLMLFTIIFQGQGNKSLKEKYIYLIKTYTF